MYLEKSQNLPKCGSSTLEQKEDVSTLKDEEKDKAEQSKGTFYFEKVNDRKITIQNYPNRSK